MKNLILLISLFSALNLSAQNRATVSYFGTAALDFSVFPPQAITSSAMHGVESPASICDEQGYLLFYSNGGDSPLVPTSIGGIWNKNNVLMENGDLTGLGGCLSSYYGATIIPIDTSFSKVGLTNIYYLITNDCVESNYSGSQFNAGLRYCVIDMTYNGGLGKVIQKNTSILPFSSSPVISTNLEPISAIVHANNKDYWLFGYHNDSLYSLKISASGFTNYHSYFLGKDPITISPNGQYLICEGNLYGLDNSTAALTFLLNLNTNNCAFSSNGRVLYTMEGQILSQYDLTASTILDSKTYIATIGNECQLVLAPDYRIYFFVKNGTSFAGYVSCPNTLGMACNVGHQTVDFGGKNAEDYFTNIPANFLYQEGETCLLGIQKNGLVTELVEVYPNPVKNELTIESQDELNQIEVFSITGQLLQSITPQSKLLKIDLAIFEQGVYLVKVHTKNGIVSTSRVVKE